MKPFSITIFFTGTIVFGILMVPGFIAAFAEDEGTLPKSLFWFIFAKLFYVLRFPTHVLFWSVFSSGGASIYFGGLLLNCLFYGLVTERFFSKFILQKK